MLLGSLGGSLTLCVAHATVALLQNFFGCEELAFNKGVKYIADDIALECEVGAALRVRGWAALRSTARLACNLLLFMRSVGHLELDVVIQVAGHASCLGKIQWIREARGRALLADLASFPFLPLLHLQGKGAKDCGSKPTMRTK